MSYAYMSTGHSPLRFRLIDMPVFFSDIQCLEVIQKVLEEDGRIRNFPGIVEDERWLSKKRVGLFQDVRYEAQFWAMENDTYLMKWLIQPSGWHWVDDDGFGFSGDSSIMLYTIVDQDGFFAKEFELFSINQTQYCHDFDQYISE